MTTLNDNMPDMTASFDLDEMMPAVVPDQGESDRDRYYKKMWETVELTMTEAGDARGPDEAEWESWGSLYMGDDWVDTQGFISGYQEQSTLGYGADDQPDGQTRRYRLYKIQNAVISNASEETKDSSSFVWKPVESALPEAIYLRPSGGRKLMRYLETQARTTMEQQQAFQMSMQGMAVPPTMPIEEVSVQEQAHKLRQSNQLTDGQLSGQEPLVEDVGQFDLVHDLIEADVLDDEDVIFVNDVYDAQVAQTMFDVLFERANGDHHVLINSVSRSIFGSGWVRLQWNSTGPRKNTFSLEQSHLLNVWCDKTHQMVEDMDYLHYDHVMSLDEAKGRFPDAVDVLDEAATMDSSLWGGKTRRGSFYKETASRRPMVIVRTSWLRHQQVPMTPDEAREDGLIQDETGAWAGSDGLPVTPPDPQKGGPPGSDGWPTTTGILQVVSLPDLKKVVDVRRNPYLDIPFALNINIFKPFSPYGIGDPARLSDLNLAIERLASVLIGHSFFYQYPMTYMRSSTYVALQAMGIEFHIEPGVVYPIADQEYDIMMRHGRASLTEQVPPIPAGYFTLLDNLLALHDTISGNTNLRQSQPPFTGASGELVKQLISASSGPLAMRSMFAENAWTRVAREAMHCIMSFMDTDAVGTIVSRIPRHVLEVILGRLSMKANNVQVEIFTGKGVNRQQKQQTALALYDRKLLDKQTALEEMRIPNTKVIIKRLQRDVQSQQPAPQNPQMIEQGA